LCAQKPSLYFNELLKKARWADAAPIVPIKPIQNLYKETQTPPKRDLDAKTKQTIKDIPKGLS
jgi:hypothetical protein